MKPDDRDIICEQDYTPLSNAELVAHIERYAGLMHSTPLSDGEWLDDIIGPARVLLARAEAAEARAAEFTNANNELARLNADLQFQIIDLQAALDAERAARQWRPVTEKPPKPDWYQVAETPDDLFGTHAYFNGAVWGSCSPLWYRSILPLPAAPQEPQ